MQIPTTPLSRQQIQKWTGRGPTSHKRSKQPATMTSPWERITDAAYKQWLLDIPLTDSEYNEASIIDRRALLTQYQGLQQQQDGE